MSNPVSDLILGFQGLVADVPDLVQPLIVALAGAVPFIEGEGAAAIGILGGIPPVVAALAGAIGNLLCVAVVVFASSRVRTTSCPVSAPQRHSRTRMRCSSPPTVAILDRCVRCAVSASTKSTVLPSRVNAGASGRWPGPVRISVVAPGLSTLARRSSQVSCPGVVIAARLPSGLSASDS